MSHPPCPDAVRTLHPPVLPMRVSQPVRGARLHRTLFGAAQTRGLDSKAHAVIEVALLPCSYTVGGRAIDVFDELARTRWAGGAVLGPLFLRLPRRGRHAAPSPLRFRGPIPIVPYRSRPSLCVQLWGSLGWRPIGLTDRSGRRPALEIGALEARRWRLAPDCAAGQSRGARSPARRPLREGEGAHALLHEVPRGTSPASPAVSPFRSRRDSRCLCWRQACVCTCTNFRLTGPAVRSATWRARIVGL